MIQEKSKYNLLMPIVCSVLFGVLCALLTGFSFVVIKYWPQPASVVPALGFGGGLWWGGIVGGITGFVLGFLTDENHFA